MDKNRFVIRMGQSNLVLLRWDPHVATAGIALPLSPPAIPTALHAYAYNAATSSDLPGAYRWSMRDDARHADAREMVCGIAEAVERRGVLAYHVGNLPLLGRTAGAFSQTVAASLASDSAVPFIDDAGAPVLDQAGLPMQRPAGLDPHMFVERGIADKGYEDMLLRTKGGRAVFLGLIVVELAKFKHGGAWDAQRIGGRYHPEFVDYATVVIGLYGAASGMKRNENLTLQNTYAGRFSRYSANTPMDGIYRHLPVRNVNDTDIGYGLVTSGRIRSRVSP